jgi:Coenzyme PQQ synthesis protein D (PqqD)
MWKSKEHVVWRTKGDLLVILDTVSGHYYTLNEVAVHLWRGLFEEKKILEAVLGEIKTRYVDAPEREELEADCRASLAFWAAEGLVEQSSA